MREYTSEPMNPGPFKTIWNTFQLCLLPFAIIAFIKSENTKKTFTFCSYTENPKTTLLYSISFSLLFVIYFSVSLFSYNYFKILCLTTTRWSWRRKTRNLFCRLLDENGKSFYDCSPRVQYETPSHPCGKDSLATSLCTWSPNELAHLLSVINIAIIWSKSPHNASNEGYNTHRCHRQWWPPPYLRFPPETTERETPAPSPPTRKITHMGATVDDGILTRFSS
jgi:hypothetical protein